MKIVQISSLWNRTFWDVILLCGLLITTFIVPVIPMPLQQTCIKISFTLLYFSAIFTLEKKYNYILVISILALIMEWVAGLFDLVALQAVSKILNITFFIIIVVSLIHQVAAAKEVTARVVLGSVMGYILLGLVFSIFSAFIMQIDPSAYNVPHLADEGSRHLNHLSESIYFSFVTLATLGYGDILPLQPYTRSLAVFVAVSGQLYVTIIIALIVGKFTSGIKKD